MSLKTDSTREWTGVWEEAQVLCPHPKAWFSHLLSRASPEEPVTAQIARASLSQVLIQDFGVPSTHLHF